MTLLLESGSRSLFDYLEAEERSTGRPATAARVVPPVSAAAPAPAAPVARAGTLDDLISGAWEGLAAAAHAAACIVCGGELVPRWSAGAGVVGGRCRDCGSELS